MGLGIERCLNKNFLSHDRPRQCKRPKPECCAVGTCLRHVATSCMNLPILSCDSDTCRRHVPTRSVVIRLLKLSIGHFDCLYNSFNGTYKFLSQRDKYFYCLFVAHMKIVIIICMSKIKQLKECLGILTVKLVCLDKMFWKHGFYSGMRLGFQLIGYKQSHCCVVAWVIKSTYCLTEVISLDEIYHFLKRVVTAWKSVVYKSRLFVSSSCGLIALFLHGLRLCWKEWYDFPKCFSVIQSERPVRHVQSRCRTVCPLSRIYGRRTLCLVCCRAIESEDLYRSPQWRCREPRPEQHCHRFGE